MGVHLSWTNAWTAFIFTLWTKMWTEFKNLVNDSNERSSRSFEPRHQKLLWTMQKKLNISSHYRKRLQLPKNSTLFTFKIAKRTQKWTILGNRERPWERSFMLKSGTRTRTSTRFLKENGNGNAVHYICELPYLWWCMVFPILKGIVRWVFLTIVLYSHVDILL